MKRIKTEIESLKKKEPPRRISELHFFNQPTSQNAKVKLSKLMHNIIQPSASPCHIKHKQFNRSIVIEDLTQRVKNQNKPSRFIEVKDNQFFRKKEYSQPKQNITFRNTRILMHSTTRKQLLMTTEQQMVSDIMAIPIQKQPCPQSSSKTTYVQPFLEPIKSKLYHIEGSVEKALEDFNNRIFGSSTVKKLINSVKPWVNQLQQKKSTKYKRVRMGLLQLLNHIHKLKLTLEEFGQGIFPTHPYQRVDSEKFFQYCKMNKADLVEKMLEHDKFFVYEYDPSFMTALHWSCVRNCRAVALLLLRYGADPDAQDMIGRTPLFLALLHTNNDIAQLLLYHKADPWNKGNLNYLESVTNNQDGKSLLQQMRRTHILLRMTPPAQRQYIWQQKQLQMLN